MMFNILRRGTTSNVLKQFKRYYGYYGPYMGDNPPTQRTLNKYKHVSNLLQIVDKADTTCAETMDRIRLHRAMFPNPTYDLAVDYDNTQYEYKICQVRSILMIEALANPKCPEDLKKEILNEVEDHRRHRLLELQRQYERYRDELNEMEYDISKIRDNMSMIKRYTTRYSASGSNLNQFLPTESDLTFLDSMRLSREYHLSGTRHFFGDIRCQLESHFLNKKDK